jgi:outer membrane protein TolC
MSSFSKTAVSRSSAAKVWPLALACFSMSCAAWAQDSSSLPSAPVPQVVAPSATTKIAGVQVPQSTPGALPLSLDEAVERGFTGNLQMQMALQNTRAIRGQVMTTVGNDLLPNMTADLSTGTQEINLAALGFRPSLLGAFGFAPGTVKTIVKVDTTSAKFSLNQLLFSAPALYLLSAARNGERVAEMTWLQAQGDVTQAVATQYLKALADQANIANTQALEKTDEEVLRQASASHDAGVGTNLDVLRARVQLQTQQQAVINAENAFAKDKIQLNRLIGLPADQELDLTDKAPYAELEQMPLDKALAIAYTRRKDLLSLEAQMDVAVKTEKAIKYERAPVLSFGGYYGVLGETHGLYHGNFAAQGNVEIPLFNEAQFRGEHEVAVSQMMGLRQQMASLKVTIDQQIRASMLDVQSSSDLVKVAKSNVDLSTQELQDATDRFAAGVDDNLAVVQAQATLASAQSQLVSTLYQFNASKLALARNTGVVETQYKVYLGR